MNVNHAGLLQAEPPPERAQDLHACRGPDRPDEQEEPTQVGEYPRCEKDEAGGQDERGVGELGGRQPSSFQLEADGRRGSHPLPSGEPGAEHAREYDDAQSRHEPDQRSQLDEKSQLHQRQEYEEQGKADEHCRRISGWTAEQNPGPARTYMSRGVEAGGGMSWTGSTGTWNRIEGV